LRWWRAYRTAFFGSSTPWLLAESFQFGCQPFASRPAERLPNARMTLRTYLRDFTVSETNAPTTQTGALVVGGEHPGLGVARSLGRRGIPVYVLDDQQSVSSFSRYTTRVIRVPDLRNEARTVDTVLEVGRRFNLKNWVLFPTRDETVAAFSRHRGRLQEFFRVTTPEWASIKWAWNKKNTYELANRLKIPCPQTFSPRSADDLASLYPRLPLAIKPAVKENFFYAT